jgi:RNA polymerase sigma-54 factor
MALVPRLDLRQVQSLVMTPQLQQAIKLLQMSSLELVQYVEQELEQNPLLERENSDGTSDRDETPTQPDSEASGADGEAPDMAGGLDDGPPQQDSVELVGNDSIALDHDAGLDADYENVWSGDTPSDSPQATEADTLHWQVQGAGGFDLDDPDLENAPAEEILLRDHLIGQVNVDFDDPVERMIAVYMVDLLDESGYLIANLNDVAETLGCLSTTVEQVLEKVQQFDPPGIFARNLSECIALQLKDKDRYDPAMQALVENLELLGKREFKALRKLCGVDTEDIAEMVEEIKALNPKPALAFDHTVAQAVTPDVTVRRRAGGGWFVEVNSDSLPQVLVNNRYYSEINKQAMRQEDKEYIADCYQSANWLVRALHQRAQTILRVSTEIVRHQEAFLEKGVQYLKPLVLRDIGKTLDVHESTVSRVTTNKYMATPRGIFELKYFFTFAVGESLDGSDAPSAEAIRYRIKALIEAESLENVLSDDKIVSILRNDGLDVARRTIAKYRESMHIPSSVQRRREKTMRA